MCECGIQNSKYFNKDYKSSVCIGDWVVGEIKDDQYIINRRLDRKTRISRKATGNEVKEQVLASNIDKVFIIQSLNNDFNIRRMERYLISAWDSGAEPIIVLTKLDCCDNSEAKIAEVEQIAFGVKVIAISTLKNINMERLIEAIGIHDTVVMLGSSGVGKTTLFNFLVGKKILETKEIRKKDDKGKHTTTHRQMMLISNGGIIIDTPGMRSLEIWDGGTGVKETFKDVEELIRECKFNNCTHKNEPGCKIQESLKNGRIDRKRWDSYLKIVREMNYQKERKKAKIEKINKKSNYNKKNKRKKFEYCKKY